jgi:hypothetical protein
MARGRLIAAARRCHDALFTDLRQMTRLTLPAWYSCERHTLGLYESVIASSPPREAEDYTAEDIEELHPKLLSVAPEEAPG